MVIGVVPNSSSAESLLNNLHEADFKSGDISVVMRDRKLRNAIAGDAGPFKGVDAPHLPSRLVAAGLSEQDAKAVAEAVAEGQVLVAIRTDKGSEAAAAEMLKDVAAAIVHVL